MASDFKFNKNAIDQIARDAVKQYARDTQPLLDRLAVSEKGKPVDEVKRALKREWERPGTGRTISDPELTQWAETLASGNRIVLSPR